MVLGGQDVRQPTELTEVQKYHPVPGENHGSEQKIRAEAQCCVLLGMGADSGMSTGHP